MFKYHGERYLKVRTTIGVLLLVELRGYSDSGHRVGMDSL